jgi:hypothetical protein
MGDLDNMAKMRDINEWRDSIAKDLLKERPDLDLEQIDILAKIDPELSLKENKKLFAQELGLNRNQMGIGYRPGTQQSYMNQSTKRAKQEIDHIQCNYLSENCEENCNNNACRAYKKHCPGEVTPCARDRYTKNIRRKASTVFGDCDVVSYVVRAHTRPPQHNCRNCEPIQVPEYSVTSHKRLCRRPGGDRR